MNTICANIDTLYVVFISVLFALVIWLKLSDSGDRDYWPESPEDYDDSTLHDASWERCLEISEHPEVDEALRLFAQGETSEDQAVCIVRAVLLAAKETT